MYHGSMSQSLEKITYFRPMKQIQVLMDATTRPKMIYEHLSHRSGKEKGQDNKLEQARLMSLNKQKSDKPVDSFREY